MNAPAPRTVLLSLVAVLYAGAGSAADIGLGLFEAHGDVGTVGKPGTVVYDAKAGTYTVTGGGENMWFGTDAFHFAWKKSSGDATVAADVRFLGSGGNAHRKAALLIRQGLEPDAAYADAVVHGDGLTSIQYREERGGPTREIQSRVKGPRRLRIEKEGDYVSLSVAGEGEPFGSAGGSFKIRFDRAVPGRAGRLRPRQRGERDGGLLERGDHDGKGAGHGGADAREHAGDDRDRFEGPPGGPPRPRPHRGAELVARREGAGLQPRRAHLRAAGGGGARRGRSTPASPPGATTTTACRRTGPRSRSATSRRGTGNRSSTCCRPRAERRAA